MAEQVSATVLKIGTGALFLEPQSWSFPTQEIAIEEVVDGDINSAITWLGAKYYCSETATDLIDAANAGGGGSSYLVLTIAFFQSGTSNPTATEFENTLTGNTTYARQSEGNYRILNDSNPFLADKLHIAGFGNYNDNALPYMPLSDSSSIVGYWTIYRGTDGYLILETRDESFVLTDFSTLMGGNTSSIYLPEIRVYP